MDFIEQASEGHGNNSVGHRIIVVERLLRDFYPDIDKWRKSR
ncbi:hypothetical protein [Paraburkholderia sp. SIMBA_053]